MDQSSPKVSEQISGVRIAAYVITITFHVVASMALFLPLTHASPDGEEVEIGQALQVTFITMDRPSPPPSPPPPPPPPAVEAKPVLEPVPVQDEVAMALALAESAATEVFEMPAFQVPDFEDEASDAESMETRSHEMFDAMAHGAEVDPDWEPTENLAFRRTHAPKYPPEAKRNGESGWVVLRVLVGLEGEPIRYAIDPRTTATELLIQAAIAAIDQWTFKPAIKDGRPVVAWMVVPIGFFISQTGPGGRSVKTEEGDQHNES